MAGERDLLSLEGGATKNVVPDSVPVRGMSTVARSQSLGVSPPFASGQMYDWLSLVSGTTIRTWRSHESVASAEKKRPIHRVIEREYSAPAPCDDQHIARFRCGGSFTRTRSMAGRGREVGYTIGSGRPPISRAYNPGTGHEALDSGPVGCIRGGYPC